MRPDPDTDRPDPVTDRPDPGAEILERLMAERGPDGRARLGAKLRERGFLLVWDQVDRAGPMSGVERGMFILERLYPEMPEAHRASLRRQLEADQAAGRWHGFERPRPWTERFAALDWDSDRDDKGERTR